MTKPLDDDFNYNIHQRNSITEGGITLVQPKQAKGGVYAPADVPLIKEALSAYAQTLPEGDVKINQVANLLHRLNNRI